MLQDTLREIREQLESVPAHYLSRPVREFLLEAAGAVKDLRARVSVLEKRLEEDEEDA